MIDTATIYIVSCDDCGEPAPSKGTLGDAWKSFFLNGGYIDGDTALCVEHAPRCPGCGEFADAFKGEEIYHVDDSLNWAIEHEGYCPGCVTGE